MAKNPNSHYGKRTKNMSTDAAIIIFSGLALLGGYLIGSIPSGLLLAKLFRLKEIPKNLDGCVSLASLWQSKHWFLAIFTIILELIKIVITIFLMGIITHNSGLCQSFCSTAKRTPFPGGNSRT